MQSARNVMLVSLVLLSMGCGRGLTVNCSATPDPAAPGQPVQWNLSVRNDSQCTTVDGSDLPFPFDSAFAEFISFAPGVDQADANEFCRMFVTGLNNCSDQSCASAFLQEALGPKIADRLRARAQAATSEPPASLPAAGMCQTESSGSDGFLGVCAFGPLAPGEVVTATLTDTAPDTGNTRAAMIAVAFAPAAGEDCRPGREFDEGQWVLSGCCPLVESTPAPVLSPLGIVTVATAFMMIGTLALYRRRRS